MTKEQKPSLHNQQPMSRFLLGLSGGLYRVDTALPHQPPTCLLPGVQPLAFALDPAQPSRTYCATYNRGLWRSEDAGATWVPVGSPQNYYQPPTAGALGTDATTFVSVDPQPNQHHRHPVWVGTELSRLYRSDDHGQTFELVNDFQHLASRRHWAYPPRPATHHVRWIAHGPAGELYLSIEFGALLRSFDGGRTFEDRRDGSPLDTHVLRVHPLAPGRLYAATGDGLLTAQHSYAESRDGGDTWHYTGRGLERMPYLYGLAINANDPDDIRLAAAPGAHTAHVGGGASIFRSGPDGWVEEAAGFPRDHSLIPALAADMTQAGRWYALSNLGFFQQTDGQPWERVAYLPEWEHMHPACLAQLID